jgi:hypothetical protein
MTQARKIDPPEDAVVDDAAEDVEIIDVEPEPETATMETPNLPAVIDKPPTRLEPRRIDALRIGDEAASPVQGIVTGIRMLPDGHVDVCVDGDAVYTRWMSHVWDVVVPLHRPGDPIMDNASLRALGRINPDVRETLAGAAR